MENLKGNSFKSREEERKKNERTPQQKIVSGPVKTKKQSGFQKFMGSILVEDLSKVKDHVWSEIVVPSAKKIISDIVRNGIDILLYGESGSNRNSNSPVTKVSYGSFYNKPNSGITPHSTRSTYSYDDIVLGNRGEAEMVLSQMDEIISVYGTASVADLYDLVGVTGRYTDNKYGWTDLHTASVIRVTDGYLLKLPKALPL